MIGVEFIENKSIQEKAIETIERIQKDKKTYMDHFQRGIMSYPVYENKMTGADQKITVIKRRYKV